jgi:hypothetical protein
MKTIFVTLLLIIITTCPLKSVDFPEIKGWKAAGEISVYNQETLFEYIDGAADAFLAYGFKILKTRDISADELIVTVDIYDMGTPLNAFGMYRSERSAEQKTLSIGAEAVISPPYQCLLLKDSYYLKINALEGDITESTGRALLEAVAGALPGKAGLPQAVQQLPAAGKITNSEAFTRKNFLNISELKNCTYAKYKNGDKEFLYFELIPFGEETKETTWKQLAEKWEQLEHKKYQVLYRKIPNHGITGVMLTNNKILGVTDCADESELLKRFRSVQF